MKKKCVQTKGNNGTKSCDSPKVNKSSTAYDLDRVGGHSSHRNCGNSPYDLNFAGFKR
jgi:hypothetical protein